MPFAARCRDFDLAQDLGIVDELLPITHCHLAAGDPEPGDLARVALPGTHRLGVAVTAQAIPFTIRDGEDTTLAVQPVAGVRQRFEFVATAGIELPKWLACDVRRGGKLLATCGPNQRDGDRIVMNLWLAPGSCTLATRLRAQASTASFVVGAQEGAPVRVELQ